MTTKNQTTTKKTHMQNSCVIFFLDTASPNSKSSMLPFLTFPKSIQFRNYVFKGLFPRTVIIEDFVSHI